MIENFNPDAYSRIEEIKSLLESYFNEEMTTDQRRELAQWLISSRENRELLLRLKNQNNIHSHWIENQNIDSAKENEQLWKRIDAKSTKRLLFTRLTKISACAAALLLTYIAVVELSNQDKQSKEITTTAQSTPTKVTFNSADGEVIIIDDNRTITELVTGKKKTENSEIKYNEVIVPEGLESRFTLSDGTIIYMNSSSYLRFPESFATGVREVEFRGEVYFQVKRDTLRPFIVKSGDFSVNVLGTTFIARAKELNYSATLSEGSVNLKYKNQSLSLTPGEKGSLKNGAFICTEANLEKEFDWVNGCYIFEDETLEVITQKMAQLYGVEFIFINDDINTYRFTGKIVKDKNIDNAIKSLEMMNIVKFHINGNKISVTKNRN